MRILTSGSVSTGRKQLTRLTPTIVMVNPYVPSNWRSGLTYQGIHCNISNEDKGEKEGVEPQWVVHVADRGAIEVEQLLVALLLGFGKVSGLLQENRTGE